MSRERLVEANPRIDVWDLHRCGALVNGATTRLQWAEKTYLASAGTPNLLIEGTCVLLIWDEPMERCGRPWFECPKCKQRARHLYLREPIACRRCHGLKYTSEHLQQTPGVGRVERLRRKLGGCDTRPFAPLSSRPPGRSKAYHERLVAMIQAEEQALVEHLGDIVRDLQRRIRVRKAKGKW